MAPNDRSNIHDDAYQTDTRRPARAAGAGHAPGVHLLPEGVRLGHVRLPRADRDHLRGPGPPPAQAAGPGHAGRAGLDGPAAAPDGPWRGVQRLQRRRLLLPGRPRPGRDPHQRAASAGGGPGGRRVRRAARLRPERSPVRGRQAHRGHARLVGADLGGVHARQGRHRSTPPAAARAAPTCGSPVSNSFAVDETGGVYIAADDGLHRMDAAADGTPRTTWSQTYSNSGVKKPGQTQAGSGTTPTLMGRRHVAITDNADPMNVVVDAARTPHPRPAHGVHAARVRQGGQRHGQLADRHRAVAGRGEQLRLLAASAPPWAGRPRRAWPAWTWTPTARGAACAGPAPSGRRRWCPSSRSRTGWSTRTPRSRTRARPPTTPGT